MAANVTLPDELSARAKAAAEADGISLDDFAAKAVQHELARKYMAQIDLEARGRRGSMTDDEVENTVLDAIQEVRRSSRER